MDNQKEFWDISVEDALQTLHSDQTGLSQSEASKRLVSCGQNFLKAKKVSPIGIFIRQFKGNPLIIILAVATLISFSLGDHTSSYYIFGLILLSVLLGMWNEYSAEKTVEKLLKKISPTTIVERGGQSMEILASQITIGDIVFLSQGSVIPADLRIIHAKDLEINESALTGESKPSHKTSDILETKPNTTADMKNIAFMGTSVESGAGKGLVIRLAKDTEFGKITKSVSFIKPETEFEKGLFSFGKLIVNVILILTVVIFIVNTLLGHKFLESLLFALAIAVGLTPELLPVIVTVSLSHGAGKLAKKHVIAKQLISLENLGNMDILCTDKTGTLTEGKIQVVSVLNSEGQVDENVLFDALICNTAIVKHRVIGNTIDVSLWDYATAKKLSPPASEKIDEEAFDFSRKCMYTVIGNGERAEMIVKGAPENVLALCTNVEDVEATRHTFQSLSSDGLRVIAIAKRDVERKQEYSWDDVANLSFEGYITFLDIPKPSAKHALDKLAKLTVGIKVITGDNELVTQKICKEVGMNVTGIILGSDIETMDQATFEQALMQANVFARVNPHQKLRIIQTLQKLGHTVGFMGDGINDIPSLHAADVGISVNTAVDVAKESASIVLLRNGLDIIAEGIIEGRRTFNNTIKYILMGTSSNFGNMFSAAGASFFLPFLPMTPAQILLTNGLYDISQLSIPTDNVDHASLIKPRHWNVNFIKNYMLFFGPISSVYDFLTFGVMLYFFHATGSLFQTGWFIESIATEILVVFVIRTSASPFFKSKPSKWLTITCLSMVAIGVILPFTFFGKTLRLVTPPPLYFVILIGIISTYLALVETLKRVFLRKYML